MKTVCRKDQCAGCMACIEVCPEHAIRIEDSLVSYNAVIDEIKCINCNACHSVCQDNYPPNLTEPILKKQGWTKDEIIRKKSSSGGLAAAFGLAFVKNGGLVCSCSFYEGKFSFLFANTEEDIKKFAGSKYVKSDPQGVYKRISREISNGQKVLFIGLPCQVAAVKNYVKDSDNLYTVDLICHGTPSPKILECFLNDYGLSLNNIKDISFRNKTNFKLERDKVALSVPTVTDNYLYTFLNSTSYTENCYSCKYAQSARVGDVTIGDSWGSELHRDIQKKGVSLVLVQTDKGGILLEQANLQLINVDFDRAVESNHQLAFPSVKPKQRDRFFKEILKNRSFHHVVLICYPKRYIKNMIKTFLYKITKKCKKMETGGGKIYQIIVTYLNN